MTIKEFDNLTEKLSQNDMFLLSFILRQFFYQTKRPTPKKCGLISAMRFFDK